MSLLNVSAGAISSRAQMLSPLELTVSLLLLQVLVGCPRSQETIPTGCGQEGGRNLARVSVSRGPQCNQSGFSQL